MTKDLSRKDAKAQSCCLIAFLFLGVLCTIIGACGTTQTQTKLMPAWVNELESVYPSKDWVAVVVSAPTQNQAESEAMNSLARVFRTDIAALTQMSQNFTQIIDNSQGSRSITFNEAQNFSQEVQTSTNVQGLIGVQIEVYRSPNGEVFVNARMNRRDCAARYSGMIRENTAIIERLLSSTTPIAGSFDIYSRLSFAHSLAQVTDNFQNILEVLDPTAVNRKPSYGTANAIRTKLLECANLITIGIAVNTEQEADRILFTRAIGSFFRDLGFRVNENGIGNYTLKANIHFETITQSVISCRYFFDAVLENQNGTAVFSFTEDNRKAHHNNASEARRLAVRAVEASIKEGQFAKEFHTWINSLI